MGLAHPFLICLAVEVLGRPDDVPDEYDNNRDDTGPDAVYDEYDNGRGDFYDGPDGRYSYDPYH